MTFKELVRYFNQLEETNSRLAMTNLLAQLFKKINKEEIDKVLYLLQGRVAPLYEKVDFGIGEKMLIRAIVKGLGTEKKVFINRYKQIGDLGATVEEFRKKITTIKERDFLVVEVFDQLKKLAQMGGEGSQEEKISLLSQLIRRLDPLSCRFFVRIPINTLRLGFSDMTILDAFSWMIKGDKSLRPVIEKKYHIRPDLGLIGKTLKEKGIAGLEKIKIAVFTPILMMRAERLSTAEEIIEKIGRCSIEPKYDGFRLQIHYQKDKVRLFSRNLEDVTYMYPDLVEGVKRQVIAPAVIFEGEAIGFNPKTGQFLPFQETVQRKRKYGISKKVKEIPLKLFVFEILYLNGNSFLEKPFFERRQSLTKIIKKTGDFLSDKIILADDKIVSRPEELESLFEEAVSQKLEGIMAKKLDGIYQAGARGWNWIKYKRSYSSKLKDTVDCLIMGYDLGRGKRAGFGIGAFLVGVYDEKDDRYLTMAKIGTGLSDEEWRQLKRRCLKFKTEKKPNQYLVDKAMRPDVWLEPAIVVEVRADEISRSPVHTAGRKMKPTKTGQAVEVDVPGYALRFPRLERFRSDKRPEDATTLREIEAMFKNQG